MDRESHYLGGQIRTHVQRFFSHEAVKYLENTKILFLPFQEALRVREKSIVIPTDILAPSEPHNFWRIPFNATMITLWNKIEEKGLEGWEHLPNRKEVVWFRHPEGTLMPAWNFFGTLFSLLTFGEELDGDHKGKRDKHGRFIGHHSPRSPKLLEAPVFNDSIALLVGACKGLKEGSSPSFHITGLVKPPVLVLSHDIDSLLGNNIWAQWARLYRIVAPMKRGKLPQIVHAKWICHNAINPREYYIDNISALVETEKSFGYTSAFYFLSGRPGRLGARYGTDDLALALPKVPKDWLIGLHYNYDTFLDLQRFDAQIEEFASIANHKPSFGRAHYLRFDPENSLPFLSDRGIICDESAGYPDRIGFRCGIAGPFKPYDRKQKRELPIWEMPLHIMDSALLNQYPQNPAGSFRRLMAHLSKVGGALSLLLHPERYNNPEFAATMGLYEELLAVAYSYNASGMHCRNLLFS